jgi:hypothetical protein
MTEQGAGGYAIAKCHACQEPVRFIGSTIEHLDGSPLCDEEIKT